MERLPWDEAMRGAALSTTPTLSTPGICRPSRSIDWPLWVNRLRNALQRLRSLVGHPHDCASYSDKRPFMRGQGA